MTDGFVPGPGRQRTTTGFRHCADAKLPRFAHVVERECAEILDYYGIPWRYEPTTFVLDVDDEGRTTEAFSPDFYLPDERLFIEITTMRQALVTRKNRKLRKLRDRYPDVNVKLLYRADVEALGRKLIARRRGPHGTIPG